MTPVGKSGSLRLLNSLLTALVLIPGAVEDWYGRVDYSTDAIGYLDISRAIPRGDWHLVFNPQWSLGYPLLVALVRPLFPHTPQGEWAAIHALNLLIYIATYVLFLRLLKTIAPLSPSATPRTGESENRRFLLIAGTCIFIAVELSIDQVSRVSPDMLVTAFFLAGLTSSLRLIDRTTWRRAASLGLILGLGYIAKTIFLPLALILLAVTATTIFLKRGPLRKTALALLTFAVVSAPLAAGFSWSLGRASFGESGALNYAFYVNMLPHWTNWQGSPEFGYPIHPTRKLYDHPPIFEFGTPLGNTYPPFGSMAYRYEGYHHFFRPRNQVMGCLRNLHYLAQVLLAQPMFYAWLISLCLEWRAIADRSQWYARLLNCWPILAAALAGIALYVLVHLEGRYIAAFLFVFALLPFACIPDAARQLKPIWRKTLLCTLAFGAAINVAVVDKATWSRALHREHYDQTGQWKLGFALRQLGLKPGDTVAAVNGPNVACTWAYMDGIRIVAEVGGEPYDQMHPVAEDYHPNALDLFWSAPRAQQEEMMNILRQTGVVAVLAPRMPETLNWPGWSHIDGTSSWIYRFPPA